MPRRLREGGEDLAGEHGLSPRFAVVALGIERKVRLAEPVLATRDRGLRSRRHSGSMIGLK